MEKKRRVIDFHTHIFPDKIASKAIPILEANGHVKANTNGTLDGLLESMNNSCVDYSIALPVATSPNQVKSINDFAISVNNKTSKAISFGAMHPDYVDYKEELIRLKENGIKGIKLHPEYQNTYIDSDKYINIINEAFKLGLIVIIHAGIDIGIDSDIKANPDRILRCKESLKEDGIFILAHMGSWNMWDEVYDKILGKGFYIDTAFSLGNLDYKGNIIKMFDSNLLKKFIDKQGIDYILFATDSPWASQEEYVKYLNNLDLDEESLDKIFYSNASKLLKIEV
ncbi:MAG: amidohydrolase family protein [Acholeplasmatales bacterium]|nr:amidohydrolase family protein [Acholeplasmatales bacterium]